MMKKHRYEVVDLGYETPCWVWVLAKFHDGYGVVRVAAGTEWRLP